MASNSKTAVIYRNRTPRHWIIHTPDAEDRREVLNAPKLKSHTADFHKYLLIMSGSARDACLPRRAMMRTVEGGGVNGGGGCHGCQLKSATEVKEPPRSTASPYLHRLTHHC